MKFIDRLSSYFLKPTWRKDNKKIGVTVRSILILLILLVPLISLSGCISRSEEYERIEQMEREKDVEGLIEALEFDPNSSCASSCMARAATGLGEIRDARAVEPLIRVLRAGNDEYPDMGYVQSKATEALAEIGEPSVEPLVQMLEDDDFRVRKMAIQSLGMISDERAIPALKQVLLNWYAGESAANALYYMGWKPNSTEENVHYLVARRNKRSLNKIWGETKQVLLNDVESDNRAVVVNAVYACIAIGNDEVIPDLITILDNEGNEIMAETYLNSGNKELADAARNWARRNGYKITSGYGASNISWGSM